MSRASVHFIVTSHRRRVQPWRPRLQNAHRRILAEAQPLQLLHLLAWRVNGKQYAPCSSPLRQQLCAGGTAGLHTQMALFVHAPCVGIGSTHSQQGWRSEIVMADQNKSAHDRQPLLVGNTMFMCGASPLPSQSHIVLDHCNCGSPVIAIDIMRRWLEVARGQPFPDAAGDAAAALPEAAAAAAAAAPPAQKMHTCLR